jgi:hypothetical protein
VYDAAARTPELPTSAGTAPAQQHQVKEPTVKIGQPRVNRQESTVKIGQPRLNRQGSTVKIGQPRVNRQESTVKIGQPRVNRQESTVKSQKKAPERCKGALELLFNNKFISSPETITQHHVQVLLSSSMVYKYEADAPTQVQWTITLLPTVTAGKSTRCTKPILFPDAAVTTIHLTTVRKPKCNISSVHDLTRIGNEHKAPDHEADQPAHSGSGQKLRRGRHRPKLRLAPLSRTNQCG